MRTEGACNDDAALVARLLQREDAAWRVFMQRFDPTALRAIARVTRRAHGADRSEVEEIHAAWLCGLLEDDMHKLRSFDATRGALAAFLHVLATRAAITHLRRRAPRRWDSALDEETMALVAPDRDPSVLLDDARQRSALRRTLAALSAHDRTFVALFYVEGQTAEQVARTLQVTIETVYTRKARIHRRLQQAHARVRRRARSGPAAV